MIDEKVLICRLEEESYQETVDDMDAFGDIPRMVVSLNKAIKIVNQLTEEYKPKTKADKIRNMSDEELADLASQHISCKGCNVGRRGMCCGITCKEKLLKWLQSDAE